MFAGLDMVDWESVGGFDLPETLHGLVSTDPKVRSEAFDKAVDTCFSLGDLGEEPAAAAAPFLLEAAVRPAAPNRRDLLVLVATIGGVSTTFGVCTYEDVELYEDDHNQAVWNVLTTVRAAIRAAVPELTALYADQDPMTRAALSLTLAACGEPVEIALPVLLDQLAVEPDQRVRTVLVRVLGGIARSVPGEAPRELGRALRAAARDDSDPECQLTALVALVKIDPDPAVVPAVVRSVRRLRKTEVVVALCAHEDLASVVELNDLLSELVGALDDRPAQRSELLRGLLSAPQPATRVRACQLVRITRADHPEVIRALAARLRDPEPKVRYAAGEVLSGLGTTVAPATDILLDTVADYPDPGEFHAFAFADFPMREVLRALANTGDPRATTLAHRAGVTDST